MGPVTGVRRDGAGYPRPMPGSWWSRLRDRWPWRTTVASAIADLGDHSERRRSNAAIWVWSRGHDSFTADERHQLASALRPVATADPDPATRAQAIAALVELGADGSVDLALAALRDPDWGTRMIVASELAPTHDQRVVDALVALLDDEEGFVRGAAAIGLEKQGDPRALEPLRAMVRREREDLAAKKDAKHAIRTLEKMAGERG
jgi:HEAT repeats